MIRTTDRIGQNKTEDDKIGIKHEHECDTARTKEREPRREAKPPRPDEITEG